MATCVRGILPIFANFSKFLQKNTFQVTLLQKPYDIKYGPLMAECSKFFCASNTILRRQFGSLELESLNSNKLKRSRLSIY